MKVILFLSLLSKILIQFSIISPIKPWTRNLIPTPKNQSNSLYFISKIDFIKFLNKTMIQSVFPPNNKSDTLFSRSGKSKMHTIFKQLEKDQEEEDNYHAKPTGHVEQMRQRMGLWHRSQSQNHHDEGDDNISHDHAPIVADKQPPSKFKLRSQSKPFRFRKSKLTSSFVSEPREANFQRVQKQLNSTMPGKYNLKYNSTEKRVLGASFGKIGAKIHKRLHASTEHSPI